MAVMLGKVLIDEVKATFQRTLHTVPEAYLGVGRPESFKQRITEPELSFRKVTLTGLWKMNYWEGQLGSHRSDL